VIGADWPHHRCGGADRRDPALRVELKQIDYSTSAGFNLSALVISAILIALYATWW
jgi:hypothetical protein